MAKLRKSGVRSSFKIRGNAWRVKIVPNLRNDDQEKLDGLCVPDERIIYLEKSLTHEQKYYTFFHELIHAIAFELHANEDGGVSGFLGEVLAEGLTQCLHDLFILQWRHSRRRQQYGLRALRK